MKQRNLTTFAMAVKYANANLTPTQKRQIEAATSQAKRDQKEARAEAEKKKAAANKRQKKADAMRNNRRPQDDENDFSDHNEDGDLNPQNGDAIGGDQGNPTNLPPPNETMPISPAVRVGPAMGADTNESHASRAGDAGARCSAEDSSGNPRSVMNRSGVSCSNTSSQHAVPPAMPNLLSQNVGRGPLAEVGGASGGVRAAEVFVQPHGMGYQNAQLRVHQHRENSMNPTCVHNSAHLQTDGVNSDHGTGRHGGMCSGCSNNMLPSFVDGHMHNQMPSNCGGHVGVSLGASGGSVGSMPSRNSGYVQCEGGMMSSREGQMRSRESMETSNEHMCDGDFRHMCGGAHTCGGVGHVNCSRGMMSTNGRQMNNGASMHNFRGLMDDGTGYVCRSGVGHHMCDGVGHNMCDGGHRCGGVGPSFCAGVGQDVGGWIQGGSRGTMGGGGLSMNACEQQQLAPHTHAQLQQFVQQSRVHALPPRPAPVPAHITAMRRTYISLLAGQSMNPTPQMQMQIAQLKYDLDLELEQHGAQHGW